MQNIEKSNKQFRTAMKQRMGEMAYQWHPAHVYAPSPSTKADDRISPDQYSEVLISVLIVSCAAGVASQEQATLK